MLKSMNLWLPQELKVRLKVYAAQQGKSASAVAAEAIADYLAFREPPEPTPPVAINSKKRGRAA